MEPEVKKPLTKKEKIKSAIEWTIIGILCGFAVFMFLFSGKSPSSNSGANIFGSQMFVVESSSMEGNDEFYGANPSYKLKHIEAGDIIFVKCAPSEEKGCSGTIYGEEYSAFMDAIKEGDVLTFNYQLNGSGALSVITHRVIHVETLDNDVIYTLCGDAVESIPNNYQTIKKSSRLVIGKVTSKSSSLGWLYVNVFANKVVMYLLTVIPCFAIIVFETIKISKIVSKDKKERIQAESDAVVQTKDDEIAALKAQIEALKKDKK